MSLNSRLSQLEKGRFSTPDDGSCPGCFHRKNDHLTIHENEPLPEPCLVCGRIPEAVLYIHSPIGGQEKDVPEVLKTARWLGVFPDDGRGS